MAVSFESPLRRRRMRNVNGVWLLNIYSAIDNVLLFYNIDAHPAETAGEWRGVVKWRGEEEEMPAYQAS